MGQGLKCQIFSDFLISWFQDWVTLLSQATEQPEGLFDMKYGDYPIQQGLISTKMEKKNFDYCIIIDLCAASAEEQNCKKTSLSAFAFLKFGGAESNHNHFCGREESSHHCKVMTSAVGGINAPRRHLPQDIFWNPMGNCGDTTTSFDPTMTEFQRASYMQAGLPLCLFPRSSPPFLSLSLSSGPSSLWRTTEVERRRLFPLGNETAAAAAARSPSVGVVNT